MEFKDRDVEEQFYDESERFTDKEKVHIKAETRKEKTLDHSGIQSKGAASKKRSDHFIDKAEKAFEDIKPAKNEAAASNIDAKVEILLEHGKGRAIESKRHYRKEKKAAGSEQKKIKKEVKKATAEEKYFNSSNTQFKKKTGTEAFDAAEPGHSNFVEPEQKVSGESYFQNREEKLTQAKEKKKEAKRKESKERKKAAAMAAASGVFRAKKNMQNQLGDMSGQGTGDLLKDGMTGLMDTLTDGIKGLAVAGVKAAGAAAASWISAAVGALIVPVACFFLICVLLFFGISAIGSMIAANSDVGESYDLDVNGDGYVYQNLTSAQIDSIIKEIYENNPELSGIPEIVLRYALSKVGCAYDQAYHGSLTADIFDCSSLAYRSYQQAGIDIAYEGNYCAANECYELEITDRLLKGYMMPGDLIFYGGSDNGRYLGIYHVAIYVGKINGADKMVEARGPSWGVVYCDVRSNNVVKIARPY